MLFSTVLDSALSDSNGDSSAVELMALPADISLRILARRAESRARRFAEEHDVSCPKWEEEKPRKGMASIHEVKTLVHFLSKYEF